MAPSGGVLKKHFHGIFRKGSALRKFHGNAFIGLPISRDQTVFGCMSVLTECKTLSSSYVLYYGNIHTPYIHHLYKQW